jgi:SAM-dependent methyltransferase
MVSRNARIGAAEVSDWAKALPAGSSILDLGCGHGVPISQALIEDGFAVHGIDASAKMIAPSVNGFPTLRPSARRSRTLNSSGARSMAWLHGD